LLNIVPPQTPICVKFTLLFYLPYATDVTKIN
jgi:hypothetical protein